jgi:SM-20-related protein
MAEDPAIQNLVSALAGCDWAVCEGFLDAARVKALRAEAEALRAAGRFQATGVGQDALRRADIRSDESLWLTVEATPLAWSLVQRELEALRLAVNAATYLGLHEFEGHYAVYPPGAAYARHLDRFRDNNRRVLSVVLYLNADWSTGDGGELRLYPEGPHASSLVTLSPGGGTLVSFLSERVPHEVLVAQRMRFSIAGWFRRRA